MIRDRLSAALSAVYEDAKVGAVVICAAAILVFGVGGLLNSCDDNQPPRTSGCEEKR